MNAYEYTAITTDKKRIQGLLWADSEDEVSTKLKLEGYVICSIARSSSKSVRWNHKQVRVYNEANLYQRLFEKRDFLL